MTCEGVRYVVVSCARICVEHMGRTTLLYRAVPQTSGPASLALEHHGVVDTTSSAPPTAEAISSRFVDLEDKKVDSSTAPTAAAADDGSTDRHMPQVSDSRHQSSPAPTAMSAPARPMPTPGLEQHDSSGDTAGDIGSVGHGGALGGGARGARVIDASPSELVAGREERGNVRTRERGELEEEKREIGEEGGRRSVSPEGVGEETEAEGEAGLLAVAVGAVSAAASTATAALSTFSGVCVIFSVEAGKIHTAELRVVGKPERLVLRRGMRLIL